MTSTVGAIYPIHYDKLQPKDKVRISTDIFTRLQATNSASPIGVTTHVDYFFVPYRLLFSLMPSMLADVNDWHSTLMNRSTGEGLEDYPHFQLDCAFFENGFAPDDLLSPITRRNKIMNNFCYELGSRVLLQLLGYGDFGHDYAESFAGISGSDDPRCLRYYDIFNLLAYQCIWQWYYRLDTRQDLNRDSYNIDKFYNQVPNERGVLPINEEFPDFYSVAFMVLQFRPWKRDFFTSNEISPLGSAASFSHYNSVADESNTNFSRWIRQWLDDSLHMTYKEGDDGLDARVTGVVPDFASTDEASNVAWKVKPYSKENHLGYQTTQQHRIAAVIEKLASIWQQTGKTYKDQMEKQFGISMPNYLSSRPIYIGSHSASLDMKPIVADVETEQMAAGTITGYGVSASQKVKPIDFEAPEHGIFMALMSSVPEAVYRPIGLDFSNTYQSRADYPLPVTDQLGQRPLFGFEVVNSGNSSNNNSRLGWLARHQELKLKQDKRYLGFDTTLSYWIPARTADAYANDLQSYYIRPDYLNPIMLVNYCDG